MITPFLFFLATIVLSTGSQWGNTVRLVWDHDGLTEAGVQTEISHYELYESADPSFVDPQSYRLVDATPKCDPARTWLEVEIPPDGRTRYLAVRAVDADGNPSEFSRPLAVSSRRVRQSR